MGNVVVTLDTNPTHSVDQQRRMSGSLALSNAYATGGDAVTPGDFALGMIDDLFIATDSGYVFEYVASSGKVKAYGSGASNAAALVEVAANTNLSAVSARFSCYGV